MSSNPSPREGSYVIDPESGAEMARLIEQDRLVTRHLGGLFPSEVDPSTLYQVLDLACGPGSWVLDVAFAFPDTELIGVDISKTMIEYARAFARVQHLENAHFQVMDVLKPLDFEDNSFDMVNARFLTGFMSPGYWPALLRECKRILRPGGVLRLLEAEDFGITNSPAIEEFIQLSISAGRNLKRTFFAAGRFGGTGAMLGRLLRQSGFQDILQPSYIIDWSADMQAFYPMQANIKVVLQLLRPFLLQTKALSAEHFEALYEQALVEMNNPDFVATMLYMSAWGKASK
jgi:ubiquinone/menaquinone biosynthesis C-methylase UbiE